MAYSRTERYCKRTMSVTMNLRWTPMCRFLGFLALVLSVAAEPAHAQRGDADAAYGDVQAGRILPLGEILSRVAASGLVNGDHVGTDYDARQRLYRLTFRTRNGQQMKVEVDATSGRIVGVRGR